MEDMKNTKKQIADAYRDCLRHPAYGSVKFHLTSTPKVGVKTKHTRDWDVYCGEFKGWAANIYNISVTASMQWVERVLETGLATADGMLTLDATPEDGAPEGISMYSATCAQQGRGYKIRVNRGIIATDGVYYHHADTAKKALSGLQNKQRRAA